MASSGLIQGSVSQNSSKYRSFIYWEVVNSAQDRIENNRSLIRVRPLVDSTNTANNWNGTCSNLSININGTTGSYSAFNSNSASGFTYSAGASPTGRTAENIMDGLSPNYWDVYAEHNTDGTKNCSLSCSFSLPSGGYGPGNVSISGTITLDTIPRGSVLGTISNFTMDGAANTGIAFSVPVTKYYSGYYDVLEIKNGSTLIARRENYISGNVTLSSSELAAAYGSMATVNSAIWTFELKTYNDSSKAAQIGSTSTVTTASISSAGLNPTFSNFTFQDFDAVIRNTVAPLTDSAQKIVKGYSDLRVVVPAANKATGNKGASIVKYRLVVGEKQAEANYSANADVTIDISDISSNIFNLYAIDSRNNSTLVTKSPDAYFNYFPVNIKTAVAERSSNGVGQTVSLSFSGEVWNSSFGNASNAINASYRFKKTTDTSWVTGTANISPTLSDGSNNYSKTVNIAGDKGVNGFDVNNAYMIEITVQDKLSSYVYSLLLSKGSPAIAIHPDGVSFGKPYDESIGGKMQVNNSRVNITGEIKMWAAVTPPGGWMVCDGSEISRTEYAELFSVIGVSFGSGNGSTTFNLPDLKGKVAAGYDAGDNDFNGIGKSGGHKDTQKHTHAQNEHGHTQNAHSHSVVYAGGGTIGLNSGGGGYRQGWNSGGDGSIVTDSQTPGINNTTATNQNYGTGNAGNLQPFVVLNYIIKV